MKTYESIKSVSQAIIKDNLCEAILIKGSIGRGDDDEYSDVDMYVIVNEDNIKKFLDKRVEYLNSYMPLVFYESVYFVAEQIVAIYENGLHFDLYTTTEKDFKHDGKIKIIYDPKNLYGNYEPKLYIISKNELKEHFTDVLFSYTEAHGAYKRKNYPWASRIMDHAIASCAILLRYIFDKEYAYLGLKKINEIIPYEQFEWINQASYNLFNHEYRKSGAEIIKILEYVIKNIDEDIKNEFDMKFFCWVKNNLGSIIF